MSRRTLGVFALLTLAAWSASPAPMDGQAPSVEPLAWQEASGPLTGITRLFAESRQGTLFAWVQGSIYRSEDDGATWRRCESQPGAGAVAAPWMFTAGDRLYATSAPGQRMYASDDGCASARTIETPPVKGGSGETVTRVDDALLAAYDGPALFRSLDDGRTWTTLVAPAGNEPGLPTHGNQAYLIVSRPLFRSADRGTTWTAVATELTNGLVTGGRHLFALGPSGLMRAPLGGETWTNATADQLTVVTARGANIYVAAFDRIARSSDDGASWTSLPHPGPRYGPFALHEARLGTLLAGSGIGIFRWSKTPGRWTVTGVPGLGVRALASHQGRAFAALTHSFWRSDDAGLTWSVADPEFSGPPRPRPWMARFTRLFATAEGVLHASTDRELVVSRNGGTT
jgi:photosystem II stability/assembly factor-like uncharacterized protein